jgi:hypothetical protein
VWGKILEQPDQSKMMKNNQEEILQGGTWKLSDCGGDERKA